MNLKRAAALAGVPYRTAARWVETGLIPVRGYGAAKWHKGQPIPWTAKNTVELVNIVRLREMLSLQALRKAARFLRTKLRANPFSEGRFMVIEGKPGQRELVRIIGESEAVALLRNPGQALLVPLIEKR